MGQKGPIREEGAFPLGPCAKEGPTPPSWPVHLPPRGISPTSGREGGWLPSLAYIRRGRGALFIHSIEFSLSLSPSFVRLPLFGVCTRLGISPPYARHRADGIGIRIHLLSVARLVRSLEGTSGKPYACNPTRCCMCGTPSSSRPCRVRLHRQRSDGDVIPSSVFRIGWLLESSRISAASRIGEYDYINHVHAGTFPA